MKVINGRMHGHLVTNLIKLQTNHPRNNHGPTLAGILHVDFPIVELLHRRSCRLHRSVAMRSNGDTPPAATTGGGNTSSLGSTVVLAGFYLEELAAVRVLLDSYGGDAIKVVVSTPELLSVPTSQALSAPEPDWDQPMPENWVNGGGWGRQRTVLLHDIGESSALVLELISGSGMGKIHAVGTNAGFENKMLGQVLAEAKPVALDAAAEAKFTEELPDLEAIMAQLALAASAVDGDEEEEEQLQMFYDDEDEDGDEDENEELSSIVQQQQAIDVEVPLDIIDRIAGGENVTTAAAAAAAPSRAPQQPRTDRKTKPSSNTLIPNQVIEPRPTNDEHKREMTVDEAGAMLPDVDNFVLSRSQLMETLVGSGLDVQDVVEMLAQKGIKLNDD